MYFGSLGLLVQAVKRRMAAITTAFSVFFMWGYIIKKQKGVGNFQTPFRLRLLLISMKQRLDEQHT